MNDKCNNFFNFSSANMSLNNSRKAMNSSVMNCNTSNSKTPKKSSANRNTKKTPAKGNKKSPSKFFLLIYFKDCLCANIFFFFSLSFNLKFVSFTENFRNKVLYYYDFYLEKKKIASSIKQ